VRHARIGAQRRAIILIGAAALIYGATTMDDHIEPTRPASDAADPASAGGSATPRSTGPLPFIDAGPTPGDREIRFELVLEYPGRDELQAYALSVGDPASADYRRFLGPDEIGARFGLSDRDLDRVLAWAATHGLTVDAVSPQRIALSVTASARTVESLFDVTLRDVVDAAGRTFHAPVESPRVPLELDGLVAGVDGLDARPTERPSFAHPIAAGPVYGMTPPIIDRAYELEPLRAQGLHGEGQTVAIVSLDTFDPRDLARFDRIAGTSGPAVERVAVNGGVSDPGDDQVEVNLDIDVIRAIAPKARIVDYEGPNNSNAIATIVDRIVADGRAEIVSISWGSCEATRSADGLRRLARSMAAAATAGITVFVASGDHGAYGCVDQDRTDLQVAVDSPASDVNVVGVGGTFASMAADGRYIDEVAWEEPLTGWGSGGGVSTVYERPAWQTGLGVDNARSKRMRQVPDVSGPADPDSGFLTVSEGERSSGGGTSAATPFWAGYALLVRQLAEREGVKGLGVLGPTLYAVAAAAPTGTVFHDVTRGGNLFDDAGVGWDYATGLGSPRGAPLARAIVDRLKGG
jgi:subtilase family serine protease